MQSGDVGTTPETNIAWKKYSGIWYHPSTSILAQTQIQSNVTFCCWYKLSFIFIHLYTVIDAAHHLPVDLPHVLLLLVPVFIGLNWCASVGIRILAWGQLQRNLVAFLERNTEPLTTLVYYIMSPVSSLLIWNLHAIHTFQLFLPALVTRTIPHTVFHLHSILPLW